MWLVLQKKKSISSEQATNISVFGKSGSVTKKSCLNAKVLHFTLNKKKNIDTLMPLTHPADREQH